MEKKKKIIKKRRIRRRPCFFLANKIELLDYKDINLLSRFVTDRGKVAPKRNSAVSAKWQRKLATAVKRARFMALLPYRID